MSTQWFPSLQRVCEAVPKANREKQFQSLSALQRLLVFVVSGVTVVTVAPALSDGDGLPVVAVTLAFGTVWALTDLIAWYSRQ